MDKKRVLQPEKDNPFWRQLLHKLSTKLDGELEMIFPTEWNNQSFSLFHCMEQSSFRRELQYSSKELAKSIQNPELVFWLITANSKPQILLFGYAISDEHAKSFYLDTLAVRRRGEGIGDMVMEFLIRWAKTKQYEAIVLDTELKDEKGFPLQHFYAGHGFETISSSKNDVKMKRLL